MSDFCRLLGRVESIDETLDHILDHISKPHPKAEPDPVTVASLRTGVYAALDLDPDDVGEGDPFDCALAEIEEHRCSLEESKKTVAFLKHDLCAVHIKRGPMEHTHPCRDCQQEELDGAEQRADRAEESIVVAKQEHARVEATLRGNFSVVEGKLSAEITNCLAAEQSLATVTRERDEAKSLASYSIATSWRDKYMAEVRESARLREVLMRYSHHDDGNQCETACRSIRDGPETCDCGLDAALARADAIRNEGGTLNTGLSEGGP